MKNIFKILIIALLGLNLQFRASCQVVLSERTRFHIDNVNIKPPEIVLKQAIPASVESENLRVLGRLENGTGNQKILVNNMFATVYGDTAFFADLTLSPGPNQIQIDIITDNNVVNRYKYEVFRIIKNQISVTGKFYALIIGINNYADPLINPLDNCIRDAEQFYNTITQKYTFAKENVRLLKDASSTDILQALDYYSQVVKPDDSFLIFYAGHGSWDKTSDNGYWLPSDASKNSKVKWLRNGNLTSVLREINSRHTLLVTDACFAGSIFKSRAVFTDAPLAINKLYNLKSRKAMTSGTLEEVPDESAFLKYLIDRLSTNTSKYLSSEQLFSSFRMAAINNSDVVPQFGEMKDVGDEGGDFIFILKDVEQDIKFRNQ
jgi:hypothetical protein